MANVLRWIGGGALTLATAATTAMAQVPSPTPGASPTPEPVATPAVVVPTPSPPLAVVPAPEPDPAPRVEPAPTPTSRPRPAATPTPRPSASPSPRAAPGPLPPPSPVASITPEPLASPTSVPAPAAGATSVTSPTAPAQGFRGWPWALGAGAAVLLWLLWRRYQREERGGIAPALTPEPAAVDVPPPPVRRTGAPWLTMTLRPVRAGLNMITAAADCEITLANEGDAPAEAIRTALALLSAQNADAAETMGVAGEPVGRSVVPPFALAPGEARTFRGVASANLDALQPMQAGGREMLVPLVLVAVQHRDPDGQEHRTTQGFVVGVERVDSPKLAPFWLDSTRMIEQVAARPSGAPERRRLD